MKPQVIALDHLDTTIRAALKNFAGGKIAGPGGPIINGIVINENDLGGVDALKIATEITSKIQAPAGIKLTPMTTAIAPGRILVGFNIGGAP